MSETTLFIIVIGWLIVMSIIEFALMGIDKRRAKKNEFRIRESTLFLIAALGGGFGGVIGMSVFRHKTKHTAFVIGIPALMALNLVIAFLIMYFVK